MRFSESETASMWNRGNYQETCHGLFPPFPCSFPNKADERQILLLAFVGGTVLLTLSLLPLPCPGAVSKGRRVTHQRPATLLPNIALPACSLPFCLRCQIPARSICKQSSRKLLTLPRVVHHEYYSHEMNAPRRSTDVVGNLPHGTEPCRAGGEAAISCSVCTYATLFLLYQCLIKFQSTWTERSILVAGSK